MADSKPRTGPASTTAAVTSTSATAAAAAAPALPPPTARDEDDDLENPAAADLDGGAPDIELARARRAIARPASDPAQVGRSRCSACLRAARCACCDADAYFTDDVAQYGVGVFFYFRDVRRLASAMGWMAVIALPALVSHLAINTDGAPGCPETATLCSIYTMLGNLEPPQADFWNSSRVFSGNWALAPAPSALFLFYNVTDACYTLVFLLFVAWLAHKQRAEVLLQDDKAVTASDYTVCVSGLLGDLGSISPETSIEQFSSELRRFLQETLLIACA
jgi:hypothetical protein